MGKPRIIGCDEDGNAIYAPRPFRAWPAYGGYRVYCKRCKTITLTGGGPFHQPHDIASQHHCLYDPKDIEDAAS